jgi:hypothetical protein
MIRSGTLSAVALAAMLTACASPENVQASPEDTWTWQIDQNYQRLAHCVTDALNSAPVHSWFYEAPRPITSFDQQWQRNRIILKSIDPWGIQQVRIEVAAVDPHLTRVIAGAKNLEALGGGAPMVYVRASVDICARA